MKKFFRTVTALTLVCGAFAFTGCTDYEEDINSINNRLDELTTGQIASIEEQVGSLSDAIDEADGLISALQGDVDALETAKTTIEGQIKTLNDNIGTINGNISDINGKISGLETDLEKQIADAKAELEKADQANADRIDKLVSDLDQAKKDLQSEIEKGDKANADAIASLATTVSDNYSALKKAIDDANTSNKAEFDKIYGEIETLKTDLKTQTDALADLTSTVADLSGKVAALETLTAGLPELEKTVADIKENYLSKAEAADIYATAESVLKLQEELGKVSGRLEVIEDLDIAERLSSLESNYENLTDIVIPNLNDAVVKAQSAAEKAQTSAKEAMTYAQSVFGELESLERSLEVYANDIEGRFNELSAMDAALSDRADALMEFVSDLNSTVSAEIIALRSNIASVQTILDQAVKDLESSKLDKAEFGEYFSQALMDDILKANGQVNTAINQKLSEATKNLQSSIDTVNGRIDSEVMPAINNLKGQLDEVKDTVEDLENRIQSLVYVPEFSDGIAPIYTYTIDGTPVSDKAVAKATFKVTPAALADYVVNQYKENVLVEVVPVKPASTRAASAPLLPIFGNDLVVRKGAAPGYVDVEVNLYSFEIADSPVAFSLYVASAEEINQAETEGVVDMDAGTYISSEYVQTEISEVKLDGSYVLYNGQKEISSEELSRDVAWPDEDRLVDFYADYALHIKLDDEYYSLADAALMMRTDEATITPEYSNTVTYKDAAGNEDETLKDFFKVSTADPYGPVVDMAKTGTEMRKKVGSQVIVDNVFTLALAEKKIEVLSNQAVYTVVNKPVTVAIEEQFIPWTYKTALELADNSENPTEPNAKPIFLEDMSYEADFEGYDFNELLMKQPISTSVSVNGIAVSGADAPVLVLLDPTEGGTVNAYLTNYDFSQEKDNVYEFYYEYKIDQTANCTVSLKITLGQMPANETIEYGSVDSEFFTDGVKYYLVADAYTEAYKFVDGKNWFADDAEFEASIELNSTSKETTTRDGQSINAQYTHLRLIPEVPNAETSHIRISCNDISAVGNVFNFATTLETWYGVTYTYTANTEVPYPDYRLAYDDANVFEGGKVVLRYDEVNGVYQLQRVDLSDYLHVIGNGLEGLSEDELKVKFESLTMENPAEGYANIPDLSTVLDVNEQTGKLGAGWNIDWTNYTARDLQVRAFLMAGDRNIVVNYIDLDIEVEPIVIDFTVDATPVNVTRKAGSDATFYLWQYLNAYSIYSNGENFIPTVNSEGNPHESIEWVNKNSEMLRYHAEIEFDDEIDAVTDNGGHLIGAYKYDPKKGTIVYNGNNGIIASPVTFTVGATLKYYLDYNHMAIDEPQGAYRVELEIRVSEQE